MTDVAPHQSNDPERPRSWLPSPGCLFALTLPVILASVCFWIGQRVQRQLARLEYFEEIDADVRTEPASPAWLHDLVSARLGEEHAPGFTVVKDLDLNDTLVTDDGLQHLSGLTNLELLTLDFTEITDAGVEHLVGLTNLRELSLRRTQVTGDGIQHLISLETLTLANSPVTDEGLIGLGAVQFLRGLTQYWRGH